MSFTTKFYTADHHFGHRAIIEHCKRPFASVEEMDAALIDKWNSVVKPHDIVYHLGDFAFGDAAYVESIFNRLNGRKFLIIGNHDTRRGVILPHVSALGWEQSPVQSMEVKDGGHRVTLNHYAQRTWLGSGYGAYHFYGHSHGSLENYGRSRDVGVDMQDTGFAPRTFQELTASML